MIISIWMMWRRRWWWRRAFVDHDGNIAFSEFVVAIAVFAGHCSPLDSCKVLFEICDLDNDQKVGKDELTKVHHFIHNFFSSLHDG
jgi:Ca2+-binding EF-hand superfamily protein